MINFGSEKRSGAVEQNAEHLRRPVICFTFDANVLVPQYAYFRSCVAQDVSHTNSNDGDPPLSCRWTGGSEGPQPLPC